MAIAKYVVNNISFYRVDLRIGGVRQRRGGFEREADARAFEQRIRDAAGSNLACIQAASLDNALVKYLAVVSVKKAKTLEKLEAQWFSKLSFYLKTVLKKKMLYEIERFDLESYQTELSKHRNPGTVNRRFDSFKSFFNKCVDWGYLARSPAEKIKRLPYRAARRKVWRAEEIRKVYDALPTHFQRFFYFIAATGCRPGEARKLTWSDLDLAGQKVTLRSIKGNQGERVREFPLGGKFLAFMRNHHQNQKMAFLAKPTDIVFLSRDGRAFDPTSLQKKIKKVAKELKLSDGLCIYGLRHTFTTRLIEEDIALEKVRLLVGHEKITTTQNYAHVNQGTLREAALKYDLEKEGW